MARCLILVAVFAAAATTCDKYKCKTSGMNWGATTCGAYDSGTYYMENTCSDTQACTLDSTVTNGNYTCTPAGATNIPIYPGENCGTGYTCSNSATCASGTTCPGQALNADCNNSNQRCNPGLYCGTDGKCASQVASGSDCTFTDMCMMNLACILPNSTTTTGSCTPYLSVKAGTQIYVPQGETAMAMYACENWKLVTDATSGNMTCAGPVKSKNSLSSACTADTDCQSTMNSVSNTIFQTVCTCGQNPDGNSYCMPFPQDSYGNSVKSKLAKWVGSNTYMTKCTNAERIVPGVCAMQFWDKDDYNDFAYYFARYSLWPYINKADTCVLKTLQSGYYQFKKDHDFALAFVVAGFAALFV